MTLDAPSCWERGDGATTADRVQLLPVDAEVGAALAAAVGRRIVAQGDAVEAHSPHHRAPVVVLVERISADGVKAPASGAKR